MIEGKKLNPMIVGVLVKGIEHQGIGGKKIILEREFTVDDILDQPINKMNIACVNFVLRRGDFIVPQNGKRKVYYGHVYGLGYFVAEDELTEKKYPATNEDIKEVW